MVYESDLYNKLQLPTNATQDEIKRSYYRLSRSLHPDKIGRETTQYTDIVEAYRILKNPETREIYNLHGMDGLKDSDFDDDDGLSDHIEKDERMPINISKLIFPATVITIIIIGGLLAVFLRNVRGKDLNRNLKTSETSNSNLRLWAQQIEIKYVNYDPIFKYAKCHKSQADKAKLAQKLYVLYDVVDQIENNMPTFPRELAKVKIKVQELNKIYHKLVTYSKSDRDIRNVINGLNQLISTLDESLVPNDKFASERGEGEFSVHSCKSRLNNVLNL